MEVGVGTPLLFMQIAAVQSIVSWSDTKRAIRESSLICLSGGLGVPVMYESVAQQLKWASGPKF